MHNWTSLWPTLKRLLAYGRPHRRPLTLAVLMLWLAAAAEVAGPIVISYFIDHILPEKMMPFWTVACLVLVFLAL